MLEDLQVEKDAPWKQRFRTPAITVSRIAPSAPARGILASTRSGTLQWYAWDVPAGQLKQITNTPGGHRSLLALSPDGRWVYYLDGRLGFDIGHYVRMPAGGGRPKDITPRLPLYTSYGFAISRSAGRIGLLASFQGQVHLFCLDLAGGGNRSICGSCTRAPSCCAASCCRTAGSL
jgi:hypothetical protein